MEPDPTPPPPVPPPPDPASLNPKPSDIQVGGKQYTKVAGLTWVKSTKPDLFADGEARLIATACRNIDLPEPLAIEIHKHSAIKGVPSAYPARGERNRPDWSFPKGSKFASRPRRHVVLHFGENIEGPVILGAGRFHGFGLCLPLNGERNP